MLKCCTLFQLESDSFALLFASVRGINVFVWSIIHIIHRGEASLSSCPYSPAQHNPLPDNHFLTITFSLITITSLIPSAIYSWSRDHFSACRLPAKFLFMPPYFFFLFYYSAVRMTWGQCAELKMKRAGVPFRLSSQHIAIWPRECHLKFVPQFSFYLHTHPFTLNSVSSVRTNEVPLFG